MEINQHNKKGERHGWWEEYFISNNNVFARGYYENDQYIGLWLFYNEHREIFIKKYYKNNEHSISLSYDKNKITSCYTIKNWSLHGTKFEVIYE